ncbi:hypothetical protein I545_6866 [Mycobacterium kansasii 662]|uniref:Uncharacterized protein n=1 Tax=Mycobacterium kansasii 662 TaxID=1299326 RepID=X7XQ35_MYCKA|nr:hypothetical protein I545_6866 [Mycobacterium kansasii 662]
MNRLPGALPAGDASQETTPTRGIPSGLLLNAGIGDTAAAKAFRYIARLRIVTFPMFEIAGPRGRPKSHVMNCL